MLLHENCTCGTAAKGDKQEHITSCSGMGCSWWHGLTWVILKESYLLTQYANRLFKSRCLKPRRCPSLPFYDAESDAWQLQVDFANIPGWHECARNVITFYKGEPWCLCAYPPAKAGSKRRKMWSSFRPQGRLSKEKCTLACKHTKGHTHTHCHN